MATEVWWVDQPKNFNAGGYMTYKHNAAEVETVYIHNNRYTSGFQCDTGWRLPFGSDHYECWSYHFYTKFAIPTTSSGVMQSAEIYLMLGNADLLLNVLPIYMDIDVYYKNVEVAGEFPLATLDSDDYDASWVQMPDSIEDFFDMYGDFLIKGPHWRPPVTVTSGVQHAIDQGYDYATFKFTPNYPTPLDWDYDTRPTTYDQLCWVVFYGPVNAFSVLPPAGAGFTEDIISPCPWLVITYSGGETQYYPGEDVTQAGEGSVVNCVAADQKARVAIAGTESGSLWYTWSGGVLWDKMYEAGSPVTDVHMDYLRNFLDYPDEQISYFGTQGGDLYKSEDSLATYVSIKTFPAPIVEIMSSDANSDKIVVGVTDGVWVSVDGGNTFIEVLESPGTVLEGLHNWGDEIQVVFASGYGYRSPDFGASWYQMSGIDGVDTFDVAFNIINEQDSFIGGNGVLYVFESAHGETFHYTQGATVSGMVTRIDVDHESVVAVIGTENGLYKTMDWGDTTYEYWGEPVTDVALGGNEIVVITSHPLGSTGHPYRNIQVQPNGELYLGWTPEGQNFSSGSEVIYRSLDYGETWTAFVLDSEVDGGGKGIQVCAVHAAGYLIATLDSPVYESTDASSGSWVQRWDSLEQSAALTSLKTSLKYAGTWDPIAGSYHGYRSIDGGVTLDQLGSSHSAEYVLRFKYPSDQGRGVYQSGYRGDVMFNTTPWSTDFWTKIGPGTSSGMGTDFGVHHATGKVVLKRNDDMLTYTNWTNTPTTRALPAALQSIVDNDVSISIDPQNSDRVLMVADTADSVNRGLWMSEDFCVTWTRIGNYTYPKTAIERVGVLYDQYTSGVAYMWGPLGFYVSVDNGFTWTPKNQGIDT